MLLMTAAVVQLLLATIACGYYAGFAFLGRFAPRPRILSQPRTRFTVLIPAHNEEQVLPATLCSLRSSCYPEELYRVLVIADNCNDRTAEMAREFGVECLIRQDPDRRGKGFALAFGIPAALANRPDAVLILDADCRLHPDALRELAAAIETGVPVVQAAVRLGDPRSGAAGLVMAVGSEIENLVQAGISRCGGRVRLRGTGMAFTRAILEQFPWRSYGLTEDAEYSAELRRARIPIRFVATAVVQNSPPANLQELCRQRRRWREALRTETVGIIERGLMSKPLVLLQLGLTCATVAVLFFLQRGILANLLMAWSLGLIAATGWVYGMALIRLVKFAEAWRSLLLAPLVVWQLLMVTLAGFWRRGGTWVRTPREASPVIPSIQSPVGLE